MFVQIVGWFLAIMFFIAMIIRVATGPRRHRRPGVQVNVRATMQCQHGPDRHCHQCYPHDRP